MLSSARSAAETAAGMNRGFNSVVQAVKSEAEKTRVRAEQNIQNQVNATKNAMESSKQELNQVANILSKSDTKQAQAIQEARNAGNTKLAELGEKLKSGNALEEAKARRVLQKMHQAQKSSYNRQSQQWQQAKRTNEQLKNSATNERKLLRMTENQYKALVEQKNLVAAQRTALANLRKTLGDGFKEDRDYQRKERALRREERKEDRMLARRSMLGRIGAGGRAVAGGAGAAFGAVTGALGSVIAPLTSSLGKLLSWGTVLSGAILWFVNSEYWPKFIKALQDFLKDEGPIHNIIEFFKKLFEPLEGITTDIFEGNFDAVFDKITLFADDVFTKILNGIIGAWNSLVDKLPGGGLLKISLLESDHAKQKRIAEKEKVTKESAALRKTADKELVEDHPIKGRVALWGAKAFESLKELRQMAAWDIADAVGDALAQAAGPTGGWTLTHGPFRTLTKEEIEKLGPRRSETLQKELMQMSEAEYGERGATELRIVEGIPLDELKKILQQNIREGFTPSDAKQNARMTHEEIISSGAQNLSSPAAPNIIVNNATTTGDNNGNGKSSVINNYGDKSLVPQGYIGKMLGQHGHVFAQ